MAWVAIAETVWEYSTTPEVDDPDNAAHYTGHVLGIKTDSYGRELYSYCRQTHRATGIGKGGLNKTNLEAVFNSKLRYGGVTVTFDGYPVIF